MTLKPPALPRPSTGGAPKTATWRFLHFAVAGGSQLRGDGVGRHLAAVAMVELLEDDVHRAEVRADGVLHDRLAGDRDRVGDARDAAARSARLIVARASSPSPRATSTWAMTACVRSSDAESGSCTLTSR